MIKKYHDWLNNRCEATLGAGICLATFTAYASGLYVLRQA